MRIYTIHNLFEHGITALQILSAFSNGNFIQIYSNVFYSLSFVKLNNENYVLGSSKLWLQFEDINSCNFLNLHKNHQDFFLLEMEFQESSMPII